MLGHYPRGGSRSPLVATALLAAAFLSAPGAAAAAPVVVINEIMWDGTEYLELKNTTDDVASLAGFALTRQQAGGAVKTIVVFDEDDSIAAQGYFLLEKTEAAVSREADKTVSGLTLTNTGELVQLVNTEGTVIDSANQLGAWFAGENTEAGVAMERTNLDAGTLAANWHTSTVTIGSRQGTPGETNSVPAVNAPPVAVIDGPATALTKQSVTYSAEDSFDPENQSLTFAWTLGDGTTATGTAVSHSYTTPGTYTVRLAVSDGEQEAEDTQGVTVSTPSYSTKIVVNEILPNPVGSDTTGEFVELRNLDTTSVDVSGWQLDDIDDGSAPFTFPAGTTVASRGVRVWYRSETKLALNNDGDTVRLLDPTGATPAAIAYAGLAEGISYNLPPSAESGAAALYVASSTPTAGSANSITAIASDGEEDEADNEITTASSSPPAGKVAGTSVAVVALKDVRDEAVGTSVTTEGVVSVPPGVLGKRFFYVAGSGIQVYLGSGEFPHLKLGDTVTLKGEVSSNRNEARLKIAAAADIKKASANPPPVPHHVATGDIDESWEGTLVVIAGEVSETSGDTFYVDDDSGEVKVVILESTNIDKPKMKKGTAVTITGIVSETTSGYRVLPRFQEDVRLGLVAGLTSFPATGKSHIALSSALLLAVIVLGIGYYRGEPLLKIIFNSQFTISK